MPTKRPRITYLNTDLYIETHEDLLPVVRSLERRGMYRLHADTKGARRFASLEADNKARTPVGHIRVMLKAIENLKPDARAIWDRCHRRDCDIGYDSGDYPEHGRFSQVIPPQMLQRKANLGLSLRITIYPPFVETDVAPSPRPSPSPVR